MGITRFVCLRGMFSLLWSKNGGWGSGYDDFLCGVGSKKPLILPSKIFILINHYLFDLL